MTSWLLKPIGAEAADVAAVVVDFSGSVTKLGSSERKELKLGSNLMVGDEVMLAPGASLLLRAAGRCMIVAETADALPSSEGCELITEKTYRIEANGFADTLTERLAALSSVLAWWDPQTTRKPMRSREGYLPEIPALKDIVFAPVVEGKRELEVRWVDGAPPFTLLLEGPEGIVVAEPMAGQQRRATISASIKAGTTYHLVLKDGTRTNRHGLIGVTAVDATELPSAEFEPLEQAAGLLGAISDSNGSWAFEGLQRIYALPLDPRVKAALTEAIELGDWP
jgi:hypothetical protein